MSDLELRDIEDRLTDEGFGVYWDGTPSCPVLFTRTPHGTLVGIDGESVCLYLDQGKDESEFEIGGVQHNGDLDQISIMVKVLSVLEPAPDLKHVVVAGLALECFREIVAAARADGHQIREY